MRRHIDRWWVIGSALIIAVIVLSGVLYAAEADRQLQQQRAQQQQAVGALSSSVDDVLAREVALARVVGTLPGPIGSRWAVLSTFVMSQPLANSTGYIQPVSERDRAAFQRRTGLRIFQSPKPGVQRVAGRRPLHLVLTEYRQAAGSCRKRRARGISLPRLRSCSSSEPAKGAEWPSIPRSGTSAGA
jgi:hypothetical protein